MASQGPKTFDKRAMIGWRQLLFVEAQNLMLCERPLDLSEGLVVKIRQIDPGHFGAKRTGKWFDSYSAVFLSVQKLPSIRSKD
jgi:hypothetical protein